MIAPVPVHCFSITSVSMRSKYNKIKRLLKRELKIKEGQEMCNMAKSNSKQFWKSVKKKLCLSKIQSDDLTAIDLFEHFKSVYGEEQDDMNQQTPIPDSTFNSDFNMEISETELNTAIFSQNNNKSTSTDRLCAELFKDSIDIDSPFFVKTL